jgi:hypothetical protein
MTREFFNRQFAALCAAYAVSRNLSDESQDVYWQMLQDIPEEKFADGVQECLATCKFFPTIAELGDASMPPVTDYRAPLPPIDKERPKIGWRVQLRREKAAQTKQIAGRSQRRIDGP